MATEMGLTQNAIVRIWRAFGLQPHRVETFKFSKDPQFVEKVRDIVGLYLNPPDRAIVLCVDEKSQVQALNRTEPILPLAPGVPARQSHDYERNGVTSLFAAMDVEVAGPPAVLKEKHLRLMVRQNGRSLTLKAWNFAERAAELAQGSRIDVAFQIEEDAYSAARGYPGWCAVLRDVRPAAQAATA